MNEFDKNTEFTPAQPEASESLPNPEVSQQDTLHLETSDSLPVSPEIESSPTTDSINTPDVSAEPVASPESEPSSAPQAAPAAEQPVPNPAFSNAAAPFGYQTNPMPQAGQPNVSYSAPPPPAYTYPPVMPNAYPPYTPVKRKMPTGLKVLITCMIVLFSVSIVGLVAYGFYALVTHDPYIFSYDFSYPYSQMEPSPFEDEMPADFESPDQPIVIPDIEVIPNTEGITLHHAPKQKEMDITSAYNKVISSTVLVITTDETGSSNGTGIIATEDGYIITNSHVVLNTRAVQVEVKTNDGQLHEAVVVGFDKTTDLAVLKIDGTGYTPAEFGNSDDLSMGQWVLAIGNPGGEQFSGSLTRGIISGLNRSVGSYSSQGMTYIQTDAAINPGNSGGPLINLHGQVVGINSAKIVSEMYEGMGFSIPINGAKEIIDDLLSRGYVQGRVRFGIKGTAVMEMQAAISDLPRGFMIASIDEESSFTGTDVQPYDIITALDDVETPDLAALANALLAYAPGDSVRVSLFRPNENGVGGEEFEVTVTLLEDKGETQG